MMHDNVPADNDDTMSDINMTPLVDVMLVLLVIFIITVPVLTHTVVIDLPEESSTKSLPKPDTITLSVTEDATIYWNNYKINKAELTQKLHLASNQKPQPDIQLRGAKKVDYEYIVEVMNAVQQAGISSLGFITTPES